MYRNIVYCHAYLCNYKPSLGYTYVETYQVCMEKFEIKRKEKNNVSLHHVNNQALMHGPLSFFVVYNSKLFDYFFTTQAKKTPTRLNTQ